MITYIYLFFFHNGTLVVQIGSGMAAQQSFCKARVETVFKFCHSTQSIADALIVALLKKTVVKAPASNAIMQHTQRQFGQNQL